MAADTVEFVSWEEHIISQERGNRVVHYFLKDSSGNLILAVQGTERSVRHMIYVVSDEFIDKYESMNYVNTSTKWRARRDVIDWLSRLVSWPQSKSEYITCGHLEPPSNRTCRSTGHLNPQPPEMFPRKLKAEIADIVWHGVSWLCGKQLMHYPAFRRNGITISVHSFAFIIAAEGSHYLGYLEDMYEDKKRQKKVRVRWFHRDEEVSGLMSQLNAHPREVFITPHVQVIHAECIGGPAAVLTPKHFEHCIAVIPHCILSKIHLCFRQVKNNKIKPFSLSKLQGYSKQAVLSCIDHPLFSKKINGYKFNEDGDGYSILGHHMKQDHKRKRFDELKDGDFKARHQVSLTGKGNRLCITEARSSALGSQMKDVPTYRRLKIKLSGRVLKYEKLMGSRPGSSTSFKIHDEIELLCQDSGIRRCWFRCKVLQVLENCLKVEYDDVQDAEESGNLQEWVSSFRVADPDKLGQRCTGRLTIRPRPPEDSADCIFEVGAAVDVWWCDGWWEGVVIMTNVFGTNHLQIYLPGEDRYITIDKSHVRTAKDWINGSWVNVKKNPGILSCLSANVSPSMSRYAMPPILELEELNQEEQDPPCTATHAAVLSSIEEDTSSEQHFDERENVLTDTEDDGPVGENNVEFTGPQNLPTNVGEVPNN